MAHPWPLFDLAVRTPRLELRLPTDDELVALLAVAHAGVHDPAIMPFAYPWTDAMGAELDRSFLAFHWGARAAVEPEAWSLLLGVFVDGVPVGVQELAARRFPALREVSTGSWLGLAHQGQGIGKEARAAVLHLAFAGLGAVAARSAALMVNPISARVSLGLGYVDDGTVAEAPRGVRVEGRRFRLERAAWEERRRDDVELVGLERCLPLLGAVPAE